MSLISRLAIFPLTLTLALAAHQEPTYDLVWHPRADDTLTYKLKVDIESTPDKFTFTANVKSHVLKIKPNGDYDVELEIGLVTEPSHAGSARRSISLKRAVHLDSGTAQVDVSTAVRDSLAEPKP